MPSPCHSFPVRTLLLRRQRSHIALTSFSSLRFNSKHAFFCQPSRAKQVLSPVQLSVSLSHSLPTDEDSNKTTTTNKENVSALARSVQASLQQWIPTNKEPASSRVVVLLSVSGGCDSVALLHACMEWKHIAGDVEWHVMHFHHRQRDQDADEDCQLVQDICRSYQIPCHVQDWNDHQTTQHPKFSQEVARNWRRQTLLETSQRLATSETKGGTGIIITAHHLEDSQESILLKLIRGVHILNLSAIAPATQLVNNIWLVRPFVEHHHKEELVNYLTENNFAWREDGSNASPKYLRNRIRNELVPLLHDLSPIWDKRLSHFLEQSQEIQADVQPRVQEYLDSALKNSCFYWDDSSCLDRSSLIVSQALYQWMKQRITVLESSASSQPRNIVTYDTLQRVLRQLQEYPNQIEWVLELGSHWNLQRQGPVLRVVSSLPETNIMEEQQPWTWSIAPPQENKSTDSSPASSLRVNIPIDLLTSHLEFRETTVGAVRPFRFVPPWRQSPVKLRQFLRGQNVPLEQRDRTPILIMNESSLVAVRVNEKWVVHGDFHPPNDDKSGSITIVVVQPLSTI